MNIVSSSGHPHFKTWGKTMEWFILSVLTGHVQDNQGIRPNQHGFMKDRSCLTNLISFYGQVTRLVDEGKAVDVVYLDFRRAFDTVPHSIILEKLAAHGLDGCTLHWIKNWLNGRVQSGGEWSEIQLVASHKWCSPELSFGSSLVYYIYQWSGWGDWVLPQ